jgi:hypothetical protein
MIDEDKTRENGKVMSPHLTAHFISERKQSISEAWRGGGEERKKKA